MQNVHCKFCGKFLLKAAVFIGAIKCKGCKHIIEYHIVSQQKFYTNLIDTNTHSGNINSESRETSPINGQPPL